MKRGHRSNLKKGRYEKGRELFLFNGGTYHKEKGHLLERESGSYEKGKELSLFNGGTYHKEKGHLLENKKGHMLKLKVCSSEFKKGVVIKRRRGTSYKGKKGAVVKVKGAPLSFE